MRAVCCSPLLGELEGAAWALQVLKEEPFLIVKLSNYGELFFVYYFKLVLDTSSSANQVNNNHDNSNNKQKMN